MDYLEAEPGDAKVKGLLDSELRQDCSSCLKNFQCTSPIFHATCSNL